ncbi:MAG: hypothetical protein JKY80_02020 [Mariprofundaceae bacterium]|nr:hypothetical protein [Methylophaga sp.]MBL4759617.1 hypothetical protein [Mariprofundaceae bacterium]
MDKIYLVVSIADCEGIWDIAAFSKKEEAEKVARDIRKHNEIGQHLEGTPDPKFWDDLGGADRWEVQVKDLNY